MPVTIKTERIPVINLPMFSNEKIRYLPLASNSYLAFLLEKDGQYLFFCDYFSNILLLINYSADFS